MSEFSGSCCRGKSEVDTSESTNEVQVSRNRETELPIKLSTKAIEMVKLAIQEEGLTGYGLRVAVKGGGCSGLQYTLDFSNQERDGDTVLDIDSLKVYIDLASIQYLHGAEIDYLTGLNESGFKFSNPNAKRTCGCGHSFR